MSGATAAMNKTGWGLGQWGVGPHRSRRRLSAIFCSALLLCTLIAFQFLYLLEQQIVLPPLTRTLLYLFLWLLVVSAYAFHLLSLRVREQELLWEHEREMRRILFQTVESLVYVIEVRDPYTAGHQRRVANLARAIAEEMGLPEANIEGLVLAANIHDVGKIRVPPSVLSKPERLSDEEWRVIKTHPDVGAEILRSVEFPMPVAQIVRQHHERLDGSGYGSSLTREAILPEARILAVADTVEAMVTERPYRPALGVEKALEEISGRKGTLYDPEAVDACVKLFTEKGFTFEDGLAAA